MKKILLVLCLCIFGCKDDKRDYDSERATLNATIAINKAENQAKETTAIPDCQIVVTKSYVSHNDGSPELNIVFKNTSKRVCDGIQVKTTCSNNFGEFLGFEYGIVQESLKPNGSKKFTWQLYQYPSTTKVYSEIFKVHFKGE